MNPPATNHPITYFKKYHIDGQLDLSPGFQRNPVWTDAQASYLIDSILNELPIPEIFLRNVTSGSGDTTWEVVDGQQRLRAIIRFFTNELVLSGENVTPEWVNVSWETLPQTKKDAFWAYKLVVRELEQIGDAAVRDMFRRLNANQSNLNAQELRHSQYHGEFIATAEELANDRWWLDHRIITPAQIRRMLDVEFVSELLVALISGPLDKKSGLDDMYRDYDAEFPDREYWMEQFVEVRNLTKSLTGGLAGWTSKTEYYSLFVAVGRCVYDGVMPTKRKLTNSVKRLADFRSKVDRAKRRDNREQFDERVRMYVEAATRASTDLGRREARVETIYGLITNT